MIAATSRPLSAKPIAAREQDYRICAATRSLAVGRGRGLLAVAAVVAAAVASTTPAFAKTVTVTVSGRSGPWNSGVNPKLAFGGGDAGPAAPAKVIYEARLSEGSSVTFDAEGSMQWITGGPPTSARGDPSLMEDRSMTYLPSHYTSSESVRLGMGGLVGAFVDADGKVIGKPFGIGNHYAVKVPAGAVAISLGVNDDRMSDNSGGFKVTVDIPEPTVRIEPADVK